MIDAHFNVGKCYFDGTGVLQNQLEAITWFQKAADKGHVQSQYTLGLCYLNGWGAPKDFKMVMIWYRKAAEQGYVDALYNLGLFYATGQGTQVDEAEAYALWSVAAKTDSGAKSNLEIIRTKMSPAKIQSGLRRAEELENRIRLNLERSAIR